MGDPTYSYGYGTLGTTSVYVSLPLVNSGDDCVLHLPGVIGVATATGPFAVVSIEDNGTETATGEYSPTQSASIPAGGSLSIVLGAWWPIPGLVLAPENGTPFPGPCLNPINDVTRVELPLAAGTIQIELPIVFQQVCSSPTSTYLTIEAG